jgi:hypothetical protein
LSNTAEAILHFNSGANDSKVKLLLMINKNCLIPH